MFEARFKGKANAGLRAEIRRVVSGNACGDENARRVLAIAKRLALSSAGVTELGRVARDYEEAGGSYNPRCDCNACYAGNMQRIRR